MKPLADSWSAGQSAGRRIPWPILLAATALAMCLSGCDESANTMGRLEYVWGRQGISDGRFQKPRAIAVDAEDRIYVVDMTARIQVFDVEGHFLRAWQTPEHENGRPTGLSVGRDGRVLVADTHYYRVLIYSPEGQLLRTMGGKQGQKPGEFGLVSDVVEDVEGNYFVSEYGEYDRIQKFDHRGRFILEWGGHGSEPGQFSRPQSMAIDAKGRLWVADACNHRIQEFDGQGKLLKLWGGQGALPGQLYYPYGVVVAPDGTVLVAEFGNHRVQRFTPDGQSLGCWGAHGRGEGQLYAPWSLVLDSQGRMHVLDTNNHRVQVVRM